MRSLLFIFFCISLCDATLLNTTDGNIYILSDFTVAYPAVSEGCRALNGTVAKFQTNLEYANFIAALNESNWDKIQLWLPASLVTISGYPQYSWETEVVDQSIEPPTVRAKCSADWHLCLKDTSVVSGKDIITQMSLGTCCSDTTRYFICKDVDECECTGKNCPADKWGCPEGEMCVNTIGSYSCKIPLLPILSVTSTEIPTSGRLQMSCVSKVPVGDESDFMSDVRARYEWYRDGHVLEGFTDNKLTIEDVDLDDAGAYRCLKTWPTNPAERICLTKSVAVNVFPLFAPKLNPSPAIASAGETVSLSCDASNTVSLEYNWYRDNRHIARENISSHTISHFGVEHVGLYTCTVSIANISSNASNVVHIRYRPSEVPSLSASQTSVPRGSPVTLTCNTTEEFGMLNVTIAFYFTMGNSSAVLSSGHSETYTFNSFTLDWQGSYHCLVTTDHIASPPSNCLYLAYETETPTLNTSSNPVYPGQSTYITCVSSEVIDMTMTLLKDGTEISKGSAKLITAIPAPYRYISVSLNNFSSQNVGNYSCKVDIDGTSYSPTSNVIHIKSAPPEAPLLGDYSSKQLFIMEEEEATLYCHSNVSGSKAYVWKKDGHISSTTVDDPFLTIASFTSENEGNYTCSVVVDGIPSDFSQALELNLFTGCNVFLMTQYTVIPEGAMVTLTCQSGFQNVQSYRWYRDEHLIGSGADNTTILRDFQAGDAGNYSCEVHSNETAQWIRGGVVHLMSVPRHYTCRCPCTNTTVYPNLTSEEIQEANALMQQDLIVDTAFLSKTIRKKISAPDDRKSSISIGGLAIGLLMITFGGFIISDLMSVVYKAATAMKNCARDKNKVAQ